MISAYAKDNMLTSICFAVVAKKINPKFDEKFLKKLVEENPLKIRSVFLKNGQLGIKLLEE